MDKKRKIRNPIKEFRKKDEFAEIHYTSELNRQRICQGLEVTSELQKYGQDNALQLRHQHSTLCD